LQVFPVNAAPDLSDLRYVLIVASRLLGGFGE
jgi:hypothetical protein